jgi:hypothetical protein
MIYMAWNTNHAAVEGRAWNMDAGAWAGAAAPISQAVLDCGCVDSTGTNPSRHDVPTLFADPAGRVYALYGGGTASHVGAKTGPYFNAAATPNSLPDAGGEQLMSVPGAAYDFEVAHDKTGVNYIVGQQGDNAGGAGSLVFFRFTPGDATTPGAFDTFGQPYRIVVAGGDQPSVCSWPSPPATCDVFVIGRLAAGPADPAQPANPSPLYLVWGWSEVNLSSSCGDPAGFCNRGLYFAQSLDGGNTWINATKTASTDITAASILYNDPAYQVVSPSSNVGLFKALTVTGSSPGTPWIAWQPKADVGAGSIRVSHWNGAAWTGKPVDASRPWNNHLVMRSSGSDRIYLWADIARTGANAGNAYQWVKAPASITWTRSTLGIGLNWFLTGRGVSGGELLVWRVPVDAASTEVAFTIRSVK